MEYPKVMDPEFPAINREALAPPPPSNETHHGLIMGPNIKPLPRFPALHDKIEGPVLLKLGDNVSTDEISPAGQKALPFRSNIPEIAKFSFVGVDESFHIRALKYQKSGFIIVAGNNYGQGSSREHAALAPRYLGLQAVIVKSYARIHRKNLINFGILPLLFKEEADYEAIDQNDLLIIPEVRKQLATGTGEVTVQNLTKKREFQARQNLSRRELDSVLSGGLINYILEREKS
jgi:aconitate hydratase